MAVKDTNPFVDPSSKNHYLLYTGERFPRVTTIIDGIGSDGLIMWSAGLAANYAFEELISLNRAARLAPCGNTYKRCKHEWNERCDNCRCRQCEECIKFAMRNLHNSEKSRRSNEGTRVHEVIEHWTLHGNIPLYDDDIEPYVISFTEFIQEYGLKPTDFEVTEAAVLNRFSGYVGTMDAVILLQPRTEAAADLIARIISRRMRLESGYPQDSSIGITAQEVIDKNKSIKIILDWKTREKDEFMSITYALQLSAYRNAEKIILRSATEQELPMPDVDGGVIVQLRPDGYSARPMVTDQTTFKAFLDLLAFKKWYMDLGSKSIGKKAFSTKSKDRPKVADIELSPIDRIKRQLEKNKARTAERKPMTKEEADAHEIAEIRDRPVKLPAKNKTTKRPRGKTLSTTEAVLGSTPQSNFLFEDEEPPF